MSSCLLVLALAAAQPAPKLDAFGDPLPEHAVMRLGTVRLRVTTLAGVAFRKSGELVAMDDDLNIFVWPADGSLQPTKTPLTEKPAYSWRRALSPDGRFAAGQYEQRFGVWDLSGKRPEHIFEPPVKQPNQVAFSPNGDWLAIDSAPSRGTHKLFLCDTAKKTWVEIDMPDQSINALSFTPDGKWLAATVEQSVCVIETATASQKARIPVKGRPSHAALSPDGATLAALPTQWLLGPEPTIQFYSVRTGETVPQPKPYTGSASWVAYSADGKTFQMGTRTGMSEWDVATGQLLREVTGPMGRPPLYSPDGKRLASHSAAAILLWNLQTNKPVHPELYEAAHTGGIDGVTVSPDSRFYATNAYDGYLRMWSAETGRSLCAVRSGWGNARQAVFLPDSKSFITVAPDYVTPVVYDTATGKELRRFIPADGMTKKETTNDLRLSADGKFLFTKSKPPSMSEKSAAVKWDVATGQVLERIEGQSNGREDDRMFGTRSPDGQWAVRYGALSRVGEKESVVLVPPTEVGMLSRFSADSRFVAVTVEPRTGVRATSLVVYDVRAKKQIAMLMTGPVLQLAFAPDGRHLVVVGHTSAALWELASAKPVLQFSTTQSRRVGPEASAITPDSRRFITGHEDSTALVWDLTGTGRTKGDAAPHLADETLTKIWDRLREDDAAAAHVAMWELVDRPTQTLVLLKAQVKPVRAADEATVRALVAKLDSNEFAEREEAQKRLRELGDAALPTLRAVTNLTAEQKPRVQRLLDAATAEVLPAGERLRQVRAVVVLDRLGTADARALLKELAGGVAEARLTREAKAALNE